MDAPPATTRIADPAITSPPRRRRAHRRTTFVLVHAGLLAVAVFAMASHEMGATVHSLAGLALVGAIAWHVRSQRGWVTSAARRRLAHPERTLVVYNVVLMGTFATVTLSGFPVWIGDDRGAMLRVHDVSSLAFVSMVFGHLVLNRHRLAARLRRRGRSASGQP